MFHWYDLPSSIDGLYFSCLVLMPFLIHTFLVQEGNCASELLVWMHVLVICFVMLGVSFTYKFYPRFNFKFF